MTIRLLTFLVAPALVLGLLGVSTGAPVELAPRPAAASDAGPAPCVKFWGESRSTGYGYRHIVVLKSECKKPQSCDVSTDVNPEVQVVTVSPAETKEVVTFLESPASAFTPRVVCK